MLAEHLTTENLKAEADYFARKASQSFERTYGWAWLLKLAEELHGWDDPDAKRWSQTCSRSRTWSSRGTWSSCRSRPIRSGPASTRTPRSASRSRSTTRARSASRLKSWSRSGPRAYYGADADAPAAWEPSGADFFSPSLIEADLMRRVLPPAEFPAWLTRSAGAAGEPNALLRPATVTDRTDYQIVHLDGL